MKKTTTVTCCAMFLISFWNALAQDTLIILHYLSAKKIDERIRGSVIQDANSYRFNYQISNSSVAEQSVWMVFVLVKAPVESLSSPSGWDVIVTSGVQGIPRVVWGGNDTTDFLDPGEVLSGFSFLSQSPPSISKYYAQGWFELPKVEIEPDSIVGGGDIFETSKAGTTIAPCEPPSPFPPLAFLDTLISYKHQAFALGWIKNPGIVNSLDAKLDNAKAQLRRNNKTAAKNILQAFVNEVEALWKGEDHPYGGKQITSEAYALLKFNAEYLISRL